MGFRFTIDAAMAAQVHSHASIAANLIDRLLQTQEHYDGLLRELASRERRLSPMDDPEHQARRTQMSDQLLSTRDELRVLATDAKQQGSETLRNGNLRFNTKVDTSLRLPEPGDVLRTGLFLHVIQVSTARNFRDTADQMRRLLIAMSKVADPGVLAFASSLERLAAGLRPPGMALGPYAPRHL